VTPVGDQAPLIVALAGPTAVGKTEVALALHEALAHRTPVALISVDSAMVYRGMDVGTAKPPAEVLERYPHALIDIRDPAEPYSAAEYVMDADRAVREALAGGRLPVLVGGTMLYLKRFREGIARLPSADPDLRAHLAREADELGVDALHRRLAAVDPMAAGRIHPNNFVRLQRALEVYELTGRPLSSFWTVRSDVRERLGVRMVQFAIEPDNRAALHARIAKRLDTMLEEGFIDEVSALKSRGDLSVELPSMRAVGYRQIWEYLEGRTDRATMRERAIVATRQLAKRQLTWMRSFTGVERLEWGSPARLAARLTEMADLANP
jgi:tRNA dimethylallyltransferase